MCYTLETHSSVTWLPRPNPLSLQHSSIFYVSDYISAWPTLAQLTLAALSADNHPYPDICFSHWLPVNGLPCTELNLLTPCVIEFQTPTQEAAELPRELFSFTLTGLGLPILSLFLF